MTEIFTMSRGGNLDRAVESQILDEVEEFHECDEPRVLNLLGQRQEVPRGGGDSTPDWQFRHDLKRLARSLSPSGVPATPDSGEEEIALGSAEENARHYRAEWKRPVSVSKMLRNVWLVWNGRRRCSESPKGTISS